MNRKEQRNKNKELNILKDVITVNDKIRMYKKWNLTMYKNVQR